MFKKLKKILKEAKLSGASRAYRIAYRKSLASIKNKEKNKINVDKLGTLFRAVPQKKKRDLYRGTDKHLKIRFKRIDRRTGNKGKTYFNDDDKE